MKCTFRITTSSHKAKFGRRGEFIRVMVPTKRWLQISTGQCFSTIGHSTLRDKPRKVAK